MANEEKIRLAGIVYESLVNGPGIRRVLFSQGCEHNCEGCFNKETHSFNDGKLMDMDDIIKGIRENPMLSGITFSGGDPFEQADKFAYIAKNIKKPDFDIWCYTGYTYEFIIENLDKRLGWKELLSSIDILVDGKFELDKYKSNLKYRGSSNQRIINVQESLKTGKVIILDLK
jgi:anaerobic ribonucleoside-triphosphate reductase activating protein